MHNHHQGREAAKKDGRVQRMVATSAPAKKNGARKDRTSLLAGLPVWPNIDRFFLGPCSVEVPPESVGSLRLQLAKGLDGQKSPGQLPAVFALDRSPLIVGRNGRSGAEILLDDDHQKLISELHAVFRFVVSERESFWEIFDLGSLNGTVVNGRKTDHSRLTHGARIVFGAGGALKIGDPWMESSSSSRLNYFFHKGSLPVLTCKQKRKEENAPNTHVDGAPPQKRMRISEQDIPLAQAASSCATSELSDNTSAEDHAHAHVSTASAGRSGLKLAGGISQIPPAREKSHSLQHLHSATVVQAQPNGEVASKMPFGKEQGAARGEFKDLSRVFDGQKGGARERDVTTGFTTGFTNIFSTGFTTANMEQGAVSGGFKDLLRVFDGGLAMGGDAEGR